MSTTINSAQSFTLERNAFGRLVLTDAQGGLHEHVIPVRAFPVTSPDRGLSLVSSDGHELAWILSGTGLGLAGLALVAVRRRRQAAEA